MPLTDDIKGLFRLDYRYRRGAAFGFEPDIRFGTDKRSWARIRTYFLKDDNPEINQTSILRPPISEGRYRVSLQSRTNFTETITGIADITKLSDAFVLEDFFQGEFRLNPQPDNIVAVTKWSPYYTLTGLTRFQANEFFQTTERLPEVALDVTRQPLFGGPIFYEGENTIGELRRSFEDGSAFHDYSTLRIDSFHQFSLPTTWFGWLSVVPRVGFRATYYDDTRDLGRTIIPPNDNPFIPDFLNLDFINVNGNQVPQPVYLSGQNKLRTVFQRRRGIVLQNHQDLGRRPKQCSRPRRAQARHPTVRELFLGLQFGERSRLDFAIRPLPALHPVALDRFPAVHHYRLDR
jgi:Organic solvent tolerance protein.